MLNSVPGLWSKFGVEVSSSSRVAFLSLVLGFVFFAPAYLIAEPIRGILGLPESADFWLFWATWLGIALIAAILILPSIL
jgi:hypothetical protein